VKSPSILMVTTVPVTLKAFLLPLAQHFRERGWRVDAMARDAASSPECRAGFDHCWDMPWSRNPLQPINVIRSVRKLRGIVRQEGYDLVHVHTPVAGFVTRLSLRGRAPEEKPKVVYTAHGFHFYRGGPAVKNAVYLELEKMAGRWTDALVVMNREDEEAAKHHGIVAPGRLHFMHGIGVDTAHYGGREVTPFQVAHLRRDLRIPAAADLMLMIAELIPRKRPADVIRALAQMKNRGAHLLVAGTGPLRGMLARLAGRLSVQDRVHFLGFRSDIPVLLRAASAMILASEHEGLPRSVMEAMCMGTPVIGTRIRGIEDLVEDDCGLLVGKGDSAGLAAAMDRVLEDPEGAEARAGRARARMSLYDLQDILALHEALYQDVIAGTSHAG